MPGWGNDAGQPPPPGLLTAGGWGASARFGAATSGVALRCFLSALGKPVPRPPCGFVARPRVLILALRQKRERPHEAGVQKAGGEAGIRTLGTLQYSGFRDHPWRLLRLYLSTNKNNRNARNRRNRSQNRSHYPGSRTPRSCHRCGRPKPRPWPHAPANPPWNRSRPGSWPLARTSARSL
jgi:hypothetical protein